MLLLLLPQLSYPCISFFVVDNVKVLHLVFFVDHVLYLIFFTTMFCMPFFADNVLHLVYFLRQCSAYRLCRRQCSGLSFCCRRCSGISFLLPTMFWALVFAVDNILRLVFFVDHYSASLSFFTSTTFTEQSVFFFFFVVDNVHRTVSVRLRAPRAVPPKRS